MNSDKPTFHDFTLEHGKFWIVGKHKGEDYWHIKGHGPDLTHAIADAFGKLSGLVVIVDEDIVELCGIPREQLDDFNLNKKECPSCYFMREMVMFRQTPEEAVQNTLTAETDPAARQKMANQLRALGLFH